MWLCRENESETIWPSAPLPCSVSIALSWETSNGKWAKYDRGNGSFIVGLCRIIHNKVNSRAGTPTPHPDVNNPDIGDFGSSGKLDSMQHEPAAPSRIPDNLISTVVDDEALILDLNSGNYFVLNAVGSEIWASLQGGASIDATVDLLAEKYEVPPATIRADLDELLRDLADAGLWT